MISGHTHEEIDARFAELQNSLREATVRHENSLREATERHEQMLLAREDPRRHLTAYSGIPRGWECFTNMSPDLPAIAEPPIQWALQRERMLFYIETLQDERALNRMLYGFRK